MAVAISRTADVDGVASVSSVTTYSTVNIGTASADRIIVLVSASEDLDGASPSSATIDFGSGDTAMTPLALAEFPSNRVRLFYLLVDSGTSATFKITWSADTVAIGDNRIAVYSVTGADSTIAGSGTDASTDMDATDPLTTGSITIASDGGILLAVSGATESNVKTWANATVDLEKDGGVFRITTATRITAGTVTITCTGTANGENGAMAWIIFNAPAVAGQPVMRRWGGVPGMIGAKFGRTWNG